MTVVTDDTETVIRVERGEPLRDALLERGFPVYGTVSRHANCGGRGLCATCTVNIDPAPEPTHWHDAAAVRAHCRRAGCAGYKVPRVVVAGPEALPRRGIGKVDRARVRAVLLAARRDAEGGEAGGGETTQQPRSKL